MSLARARLVCSVVGSTLYSWVIPKYVGTEKPTIWENELLLASVRKIINNDPAQFAKAIKERHKRPVVLIVYRVELDEGQSLKLYYTSSADSYVTKALNRYQKLSHSDKVNLVSRLSELVANEANANKSLDLTLDLNDGDAITINSIVQVLQSAGVEERSELYQYFDAELV